MSKSLTCSSLTARTFFWATLFIIHEQTAKLYKLKNSAELRWNIGTAWCILYCTMACVHDVLCRNVYRYTVLIWLQPAPLPVLRSSTLSRKYDTINRCPHEISSTTICKVYTITQRIVNLQASFSARAVNTTVCVDIFL